jgi:hypothetical protein
MASSIRSRSECAPALSDSVPDIAPVRRDERIDRLQRRVEAPPDVHERLVEYGRIAAANAQHVRCRADGTDRVAQLVREVANEGRAVAHWDRRSGLTRQTKGGGQDAAICGYLTPV